MALKTAARGVNKGGKFWGCSNYPSCKGIIAIIGAPSAIPPKKVKKAVNPAEKALIEAVLPSFKGREHEILAF